MENQWEERARPIPLQCQFTPTFLTALERNRIDPTEVVAYRPTGSRLNIGRENAPPAIIQSGLVIILRDRTEHLIPWGTEAWATLGIRG